MNLKTFWKQPAEGFSEETRGRSEKELCKKEEKLGFKYPETYRELMKLQNGGSVRKSSFYFGNQCQELFYNDGGLDKISKEPKGYQTMYQVLKEWKDKDELDSLSPTEFNFLNRLIIISHMDGYSWMCFDYGWTQEKEKLNPEVCFFNTEFEEYLRCSNFDELIKGLVYYGYEYTV